MPYTDRLGRVCGYLNIEERDGSSQFSRRYFILDVNMGKISYYMDNPLNLSDSCSMPIREFNLQYISQVSDSKTMKPKVPFCFALHVAGTKYYLQAENEDDLEGWIAALRDATKIQVPTDELTSSCMEWRQDASSNQPYETEIAGGVVCKLSSPSSTVDQGGGEAQCVTPPAQACVVKTGYCVKQGAMRKNWKRRYFSLDTDGLSYFSHHNDKTPIKCIHKHDILDVRISSGNHSTRDNLFEVVTSKRIFYVQTDSVDERQHWIQCVESVMRMRLDGAKAVLGVDLLRSTSAHSDSESKPAGVWV